MTRTASILRYPGGKSQLAHYIEYLLSINNVRQTYIEPFAGGFGIALRLLFDKKIDQVVMNDYDPSIFSVWYAALNYTNEFLHFIDNVEINIDEWEKQRKIQQENCKNAHSLKNAFSTFFLNRTNISGIIKGGPIGGKKQNGKYRLDCRFNKKNLKQKIINIANNKDKIILKNLDAKVLIKNELVNYNPETTFIFFDPPYFKEGKKLYMSFPKNSEHEILAQNIMSLKDYKWITTYDQNDKILNLYAPYVKTFQYSLRYSANKKRIAKEYLFASNATNIKSFGKVELNRIY